MGLMDDIKNTITNDDFVTEQFEELSKQLKDQLSNDKNIPFFDFNVRYNFNITWDTETINKVHLGLCQKLKDEGFTVEVIHLPYLPYSEFNTKIRISGWNK